MKLGVCPKCFRIRKLTRHHCNPIRFFKKRNNQSVLYLCKDCHREIEKILPQHRKLSKDEYTEIHQRWITGVPVIVY